MNSCDIKAPLILFYKLISVWGHSVTTWTERGGEGGNQMSMIVHVREGGGLKDVHMDKY